MNAWEEGDKIFADVMEYPVAPLFPNARRHAAERRRRAAGALDLRPGRQRRNTIKREPIDDLAGRVPALRRAPRGPRLSPRLVRRHTRARRGAVRFDSHRPHRPGDRQAQRPTASPPAIRRASRCSCRARPDAAEGDGWLVAVVYRGAEDRSDFVVFDAQDVAAGPIATAKLPRRVPFGFHGNWRPA